MVTIAGHTACSVRGINSWNPVWKQRSLSEDTWQSMMLQCWIVRILCYCPCSWPLWLQDGNVVKFVIRYCDCIASSRGIVFSNMCCGTEGCSISTCFPRCGHCCSNLSESCRGKGRPFQKSGPAWTLRDWGCGFSKALVSACQENCDFNAGPAGSCRTDHSCGGLSVQNWHTTASTGGTRWS